MFKVRFGGLVVIDFQGVRVCLDGPFDNFLGLAPVFGLLLRFRYQFLKSCFSAGTLNMLVSLKQAIAKAKTLHLQVVSGK